MLDGPAVEIRLYSTTLYDPIYWAEGDMLVNQHISGVAAAHAPMLHLRHQDDEDIATTYARSFERVLSDTKPLANETRHSLLNRRVCLSKDSLAAAHSASANSRGRVARCSRN